MENYIRMGSENWGGQTLQRAFFHFGFECQMLIFASAPKSLSIVHIREMIHIHSFSSTEVY